MNDDDEVVLSNFLDYGYGIMLRNVRTEVSAEYTPLTGVGVALECGLSGCPKLETADYGFNQQRAALRQGADGFPPIASPR